MEQGDSLDIPIEQTGLSLMRPDQIGMQLADELINSASELKDAYAEGRIDSAYTHLTNATETIAQLMNGFKLDPSLVTVKPRTTRVYTETVDITPDDENFGIHR